ncbi:Uncharacterized protein FWK35_00020014 [Aphis craccivora]|uniref:Uncharacterized protein n=1 Tax=Aphis craccivora TaxID=307492 RepID=A0A6G0ZAK7_APHCR|nr:Uncharacterized protein FWK35_00020014 [Aphis craccivora]
MFIDSERSDECIDFKMMCVITSRNNAPISNFGDGFRCKSEYPWCFIEDKVSFQKNREKQKKMTEKRSNFQNILTFFDVYTSNFYEICRKAKNCNISCKNLKILPTAEVFKCSEKFFFSSVNKLRVENLIQDFPPLKHKPPYSPTTGNYILG